MNSRFTTSKGDPLYAEVPLRVGAIGTSASGWWGLWFVMISQSLLFVYEFFTYFYFSVQPTANWVPGGPPSLVYSGAQLGIVALGCVSAWFAGRSISRNSRIGTLVGLGITWLLASAFIALQFADWFDNRFPFYVSAYSSEYYLITGTHLAHVVGAWFMLLFVFAWTALGYFDQVRHLPVTIAVVFWYFVAAVWLCVFFTIDVTPYFY